MKKFYVLLLPFLFVACTHTKSETTSYASLSLVKAPEDTPILQKPFLWKISKNENVSYLFGTVHIGAEEFGNLPYSLTKALKESRAFVSESSADRDSSAQLSLALAPNGSSESVFTPVQWKLLSKLTKMPPKILHQLSPVQIYMMLYFSNEAVRPKGIILDVYLKTLAKMVTENIYYLEDARDVAPILKKAARPEVVMVLAEELQKNPNIIAQLQEEAIKAYMTGSEELLVKTLFQEGPVAMQKVQEDFEKLLLVERNKLWLKRLLPILEKEGGLFIAIGAGHLVGDNSLLTDIKKAGFTATRLQ